MIRDEVFLGSKEDYNNKIAYLAKLAVPEPWSFGRNKSSDPYRILKNYFERTYERLREEGKILQSNDGQLCCINTGLLTIYNQEIIALFKKSNRDTGLPWFFISIVNESDKKFTTNFSQRPEIADYATDPSDLIFDRHLDIVIKKEHIIDDNYERFLEAGADNKELISVLLDSAKGTLRKKLERNFKLALPFYYHNKKTGERKIQLLAPVYFPGSPVRLAFVLNKMLGEDGGMDYYEAVTILPVEWAYMNARLIVKPDEEWAKIIDDSEIGEQC